MTSGMRGLAGRYLPTPVYRILRQWFYLPSDLLDRAFGRRPGLPPRGKSFVYGADAGHEVLGETYLKFFTELGGLNTDHAVLEIGCGIGRIAGALTRFLSARGEYRGFDIIPAGIEWCRDHITPAHPQFRFDHADLFNKTYHPRGRLRASDYRFPYPDNHFDFAYTTSVFTHMLPADVRHYLQETWRVLKQGGRCFHTFFLLNDESRSLLAGGADAFDFRYPGEGFRTVSRIEPEKAIAYDEEIVRCLFTDTGFRILEPIRYGGWCGRARFLSGQDIVIAEAR